MKKASLAFSIVVLLMLVISSTVFAQYPGYSWATAYQVVNMGASPADITIDYYDQSGVAVPGAQKIFQDVPANGSRLVLQFTDDPALGTGLYSAVVSSDQPVVAIVNQQLVPSNSATYNPKPPFSTYSGEASGSLKVTLPAVMHNWYNYYTELFIMNVGSGNATNVDIVYTPGKMSGQATGATGQSDLNISIPKLATYKRSQENMTNLGAPSGNVWKGRFFGTATITSDQPIIAIVNQHNVSASKLMTYNGFTDSGATTVAAPVHMRNYYGYYTTLLVANPNNQNANVTLTYTPSGTANVVAGGGSPAPVIVNHLVEAQTTLMRHDGPTASDEQSDLDDLNPVTYVRFYGSVKVTSDIPVMVQINVEALQTGDDQAGSLNGIPIGTGGKDTPNVVVPVILADYYGYYTTLIVQNTESTAGNCNITYTSDSVNSAVPNQSKTYPHTLPASGAFQVYEGHKGGLTIGDINSDTFWRSGSNRRFIGSATISCDRKVVAFVNEEADILYKDSMYTFNTFNK